MYRIFKLIIQPDDHSVNVLKYIDSTILTLMKMGVKFKIVKINPDSLTPSFIKELEQKNITRLPVVITDDNKHWVGYKEIKSKIYTNIKLYQQNTQSPPQDNPIRTINRKPMPDTNDHLQNELKYLKRNGEKFEFEDESDDEIGGKQIDFRKEAEMRSKEREKMYKSVGKKPSSMSTDDVDEQIDFNSAMRNRNTNNIKNNPTLDSDDRDLLNKLGGGDYNETQNNNDDDDAYKRFAMGADD
jgi:hypothetical protein